MSTPSSPYAPRVGDSQPAPTTAAQDAVPEPLSFGEYAYDSAAADHTSRYLWPPVFRAVDLALQGCGDRRVFDLGCGNGAFAAALTQRGCTVTGVDVSTQGIEQANRAYPGLRLAVGSAYDPLSAQYGTFPVVTSLEVVEHLYAPRRFAACAFDLVEPGGAAVVSTPYHGYLKNLALAVSGKMDRHFAPLWDHGHIKFWSERTLGTLLREAGFARVVFARAGRVPVFAKSLIAVAYR